MGKRLRVVKKQEEYGEVAMFNYRYADFANLLSVLDCDIHCDSEEDYARFDVPVEDFRNAMDIMENYVNGEHDKITTIDVADIDEALDGIYGDHDIGQAEYILETMKLYYEERDKEKSYMIFVAF